MNNFKTIEQWYNLPAVKFEILKFLYNRELALIVAKNRPEEEHKQSMRTLRCHNALHYDFILQKGVHMFSREKWYNLYYSLARYINGIPKTNLFDFTNRKKQVGKWIGTHYHSIHQFDFFLDIDSPTFEDVPLARQECLDVHDYFNKLNVPHEVRFSGMGFHIIIPGFYWFPDTFNPSKDNNIYEIHHQLAKHLYNKFGELIDLGVYDSRRVIKIPYSIAIYEDRMLVCSPLFSREEIDELRLKDYTPETIPYEIKGRGTHLFNPDRNLKELKKEIKEW